MKVLVACPGESEGLWPAQTRDSFSVWRGVNQQVPSEGQQCYPTLRRTGQTPLCVHIPCSQVTHLPGILETRTRGSVSDACLEDTPMVLHRPCAPDVQDTGLGLIWSFTQPPSFLPPPALRSSSEHTGARSGHRPVCHLSRLEYNRRMSPKDTKFYVFSNTSSPT